MDSFSHTLESILISRGLPSSILSFEHASRVGRFSSPERKRVILAGEGRKESDLLLVLSTSKRNKLPNGETREFRRI